MWLSDETVTTWFHTVWMAEVGDFYLLLKIMAENLIAWEVCCLTGSMRDGVTIFLQQQIIILNQRTNRRTDDIFLLRSPSSWVCSSGNIFWRYVMKLLSNILEPVLGRPSGYSAVHCCKSLLKKDFIPFLSNYAHSSTATCMFLSF
jgi:hypothetical protein